MAQEKRRILVVGASNMELYMGVDRLPKQGETVMDGGGVAYIPGGLGICYATALARLSEHSVLCTKLGADIHGQKLYNFAKDNGVDSSFIRVDHDNGTGLSVIIREAEGEAEAILKVQKANADGIRFLKEAGADQAVLTMKSLEAFEKAADGKATKIIIPSELQGIAGLVKSVAEVAKEE